MNVTRHGSRLLAIAVVSIAAVALGTTVAMSRQAPGPGGMDPGAMVEGLRRTPGCLGVDLARWQSGKQTIAAWFEDKPSVLRWYYSDVHRGLMGAMTDGEPGRKPMAHVPDDVGPIMVLATITPSDAPRFETLRMPVSQISIELFRALPGGAHLGGRLAPESFAVPHMTDHTPEEPAGPTSQPAAR